MSDLDIMRRERGKVLTPSMPKLSLEDAINLRRYMGRLGFSANRN